MTVPKFDLTKIEAELNDIQNELVRLDASLTALLTTPPTAGESKASELGRIIKGATNANERRDALESVKALVDAVFAGERLPRAVREYETQLSQIGDLATALASRAALAAQNARNTVNGAQNAERMAIEQLQRAGYADQINAIIALARQK